MESVRRATSKRKQPDATHTNSSHGARLDALVNGAPRGLSFTGDTAALDSLDVREIARRLAGVR